MADTVYDNILNCLSNKIDMGLLTFDTCFPLLLMFSTLNLHYHLHSPQAENCFRYSRLAGDEDDLEVGENEKKIIIKTFPSEFSF